MPSPQNDGNNIPLRVSRDMLPRSLFERKMIFSSQALHRWLPDARRIGNFEIFIAVAPMA